MMAARQRRLVISRAVCRAARRALYALMAPQWVGTRNGLRRLIRRRLRPLHGRTALLARVAQGGAMTAMVAGMLGLAAPVAAEPINVGALEPIVGRDVSDFLSDGGNSGNGLSGVGDFNGDGIADFALVAPGGDGPGNSGPADSGECYVIFGKLGGIGPLDLSSMNSDQGFVIYGTTENRPLDRVSGIGDFNGDGFDDLILGIPRASGPNGEVDAGEAYVILGKASGHGPISLGSLSSSDGFRIFGAQGVEPRLGYSLSGAGDVNGDGLADLIVGAPRTSFPPPGLGNYVGQAYVVFGQSTGLGNVNLAGLDGSQGFAIRGVRSNDYVGFSVSGAGDINGDGFCDLLVGSLPFDRPTSGRAHVILGKPSGFPPLLWLGGSGLTGVSFILGRQNYDQFGRAVSGLGDVNGDGFDDILVGAASSADGEAYILFGKSSGFAVVSSVGTLAPGDVLTIRGRGLGSVGRFVSSAGDYNGDGFGDVLVGTGGSESFLIWGKPGFSSSSIAVGDIFNAGGSNADGLRIFHDSNFVNDFIRAHSSAGDVNGDGIADILVSQPWQNTAGSEGVGAVYLLEGSAVGTGSTSLRHIAAGNAPRTAIGIIGDGSNDSSPNSRCWIDFAGGSGPGGGASLDVATIFRDPDGISNLSGTVGVYWILQSNRSAVSSLVTFQYLESEIVGLEEEELEIYFSTSLSGPWLRLGAEATLDTDRNLITARVETFGYFTIAAPIMDSDGDGLADAWEMEGGGIDINGDGVIDLSLWDLGARPNRKDLFLEIDCTRDFFVSDTAIAMLIQAFDSAPVSNPDGSTGITLHIQRSDLGIASPAEVAMEEDREWPANFYTIKDAYFGTAEQRSDSNAEHILAAKRLAYRYCLFYDRTTTKEGGRALAVHAADFYACHGFAREKFLAGTFTQEDVDYDAAGVIMHELGHALGLDHGGGDAVNGKPNYPSIMNYALSHRAEWNEAFWRLDYCRVAMPPLFENSIDERVGLRGGAEYREFYMPVTVSFDLVGALFRETQHVSLSDDAQIDVGQPAIPNGIQDGLFSDGIVQDLNYTGEEEGLGYRKEPTPGQVMVGYNDWDLLRYEVPRGQRARRNEPIQEDPWEVIQEFHESLPIPPPPPPPRKRDSWSVY